MYVEKVWPSANSIKRNIAKVYAINFFCFFMLIMPVLVPYLQSIGLKTSEIYTLQAIYGVLIFIFEVPSGYMADIIGRKLSLILGGLFWSLGFMFFCFGTSFYDFVFYEALCALGCAFYSGTTTSLLYDTLGDEDLINKVGTRVISTEFFSKRMGETTAAFACYLLYPLFKNNLIYIQAIICTVPFIIAFFLQEPERETPCKDQHRENFIEMWKEVLNKGPFLKYLIINHIFLSFLTLLAVWMYQVYWKDIGIELKYFGLLWGINNLFMGICGKYAHRIQEKLGLKQSILVCSILPSFGFLLMGTMMNVTGAFFLFCFSLCHVLQLLYVQGLNTTISSKMRATANSFISMGMRIAMFFIGPVFGYCLDEYGIQDTLIYTGYTSIPILMFMCYLLIKSLDRNPDVSTQMIKD